MRFLSETLSVFLQEQPYFLLKFDITIKKHILMLRITFIDLKCNLKIIQGSSRQCCVYLGSFLIEFCTVDTTAVFCSTLVMHLS